MKTLISLLVMLMLSATSFGQIKDSLSTIKILKGVEGYTPLDQSSIILPAESSPEAVWAGQLELNVDEGSSVFVDALKEGRPVAVTQVDDDTFIIKTTGVVVVLVKLIDFEAKKVRSETFMLDITGPDPGPEPGPGPDPGPDPGPVPPDAFDNLGQRVAGWAAGKPMRKEVGQVYLSNSKYLRSNPVTVTDASIKLQNELKQIPSIGEYDTVRQNINNDLTQRWSIAPMSSGTLADYWKAIATGLGATNE